MLTANQHAWYMKDETVEFEKVPLSEKKTVKYPRIYFVLIAITATFIFLYSSPFSWQWNFMNFQKDLFGVDITEAEQISAERGFVVYSQNCKIPDIDPWHQSILNIIEKNPPLNCSIDYPALTTTEGKVLRIIPDVAQKKNIFNFKCCYKKVFRQMIEKSDNTVRYSADCVPINFIAEIEDEFIKVECHMNNGTKFYQNYHSFIHEKPDVENRCSRNSNKTDKFSVLIIGVDAMSRLNMHRQLNRTVQFLVDKRGAVEMFGFNKVGDNTYPNLVPLLMGYSLDEIRNTCWPSQKDVLDNCTFMWDRYAAKGYRTLYAEDAPHISSFNYVKSGFSRQPTDYYFRPFIYGYEEDLARDRSLNCYLCLGSTSATEAVLHWTEQFVHEFSDRPFFAFSWINSLTHDYLNKGSMGDHMYESFFKRLHDSNHLENTIVIMLGDHGMRWGPIIQTYIGRLEKSLPMLLVSLPRKFKQKHPKMAKALRLNSHRLVTPFDLYATLDNILNLNETWEGVDLTGVQNDLAQKFSTRALSILHPVPEARSCPDAFIDEQWCSCKISHPVNSKSSDVTSVANFLIQYLNALLEPHIKICSHLLLNNITNSRVWSAPTSEEELSKSGDHVYTITIETKPGYGLFEGTVRLHHNQSDHNLLGSLSRLNLYGNQSACIQDSFLRPYCYCS